MFLYVGTVVVSLNRILERSDGKQELTRNRVNFAVKRFFSNIGLEILECFFLLTVYEVAFCTI